MAYQYNVRNERAPMGAFMRFMTKVSNALPNPYIKAASWILTALFTVDTVDDFMRDSLGVKPDHSVLDEVRENATDLLGDPDGSKIVQVRAYVATITPFVILYFVIRRLVNKYL